MDREKRFSKRDEKSDHKKTLKQNLFDVVEILRRQSLGKRKKENRILLKDAYERGKMLDF
jgi:hypothetical protein